MSESGCTFLVIIVIDLDQLIGDVINCLIRVIFFKFIPTEFICCMVDTELLNKYVLGLEINGLNLNTAFNCLFMIHHYVR